MPRAVLRSVFGLLVLGVLGMGRGEQVAAQSPSPYAQRHWTAEDGLPLNVINDVAQDRAGYLWLATGDGLVRFNGTSFETHRPRRKAGLADQLEADHVLDVTAMPARGPGGVVAHLSSLHLLHTHRGTLDRIGANVLTYHVAPDGAVWMGTRQGVVVYRDGHRQRIAPERIQAEVRGLMYGPDGTLWVGTRRQGLYRRGPNGAIEHLTTEEGLLDDRVTTFAHGDDGAVWIGTWSGVQRWDGEALRTVAPADPNAEAGLHVFQLRAGVGDAPCWVRTNRGVYRCQGRRLVPFADAGTRSYPPPTTYLLRQFVQEGPDGHVFVNTGTTLYRDQTPILNVEGEIRAVVQDRAGTLWVGTGNNGLFQLQRTVITSYGRPEGLPSNEVTTIVERRQGGVWMGTVGGHLVDFREGAPVSYDVRPSPALVEDIWTLHVDRSNQLWVGGWHLLCRFQDGACDTVAPPEPMPPDAFVAALHEDRRGRLWIGTFGDGVFRRRPRPNGPPQWTHFTPDNSALPGEHVRFLHETPSGTLWMATVRNGLVRFRDGTFRPLAHDAAPTYPKHIHQDTSGVLWVGTQDAGLYRIARRGNAPDDSVRVTTYRERDGLHQNTIHQILSDARGRLWMNTNMGLFWVEKSDLEAVARGTRDRIQSVVYTTHDGLRNVEGNGYGMPTAVQMQDGRLWFPTQGGAAVVDPGRVPLRVPPPSLHVEAITSGTEVVAAPPDTAVSLATDQRTFTVRYAGLHLRDPSAVEYRYRLADLQTEWQLAGAKRRASFTAVPPGRYTFEVAARTKNGPWSASPTRIHVTVAPFWWETRWFYVLCGVGLLALAGLGYRWRIRQLRRRQDALETAVRERTEEVRRQRNQLEEQADRLKELDEAKSRFFTNLSHEFRTPLTLIRGPVRQVRTHLERGRLEGAGSDADTDAEQLTLVERNVDRLQRLIDQILGLARLEAGTYELHARPTDVGKRVEDLVREFRPLAERAGIALSVDADSRAGPGASGRRAESEAVYVDREALERIVSNLLSNAVKFTPEGGRVTVTVSEHDDAVDVAVADTGPGIPEEEQDDIFDRFAQADDTLTRKQEGVGIGLAFAQDLVVLHGGTLRLDSTEGEGTTFTVRLPRGSDHLRDDQIARASGTSSVDASEDSPEAGPTQPALPPSPADSPPASLDPAASVDGASSPAVPSSSNDDSQVDPRSSKVVLVVDDNADVRRYVRSVLEPEFTVLEAADGEEGTARAREELPDVILADVMMPVVDGHEMTRRLKENPETEAIPIIMVTARAETRDEVEGLRVGADDYVTKPFDATVLRQRVGGVLTLQERLRRQLREERSAETEEPPASVESEERPKIERRARTVVRRNLTETDFGVTDLAEEMAMSRSTLYRKLKAAAEVTPSALITEVRIEEAQVLLRDGEPVTQVAYAVGYDTLSTFSRVFGEEVGTSPSAYARA